MGPHRGKKRGRAVGLRFERRSLFGLVYSDTHTDLNLGAFHVVRFNDAR